MMWIVKRGRRRWFILLGAVVVVASVSIWLVRSASDPLSFLDRFRPQRFEVKSPSNPSGLGRHMPWPEKTTILIFSYADAPEVLKALNRELTPATGYRVRNELL